MVARDITKNFLNRYFSYSDGSLVVKRVYSKKTPIGKKLKGHINSEGYPYLSILGCVISRHRAVWIFHKGRPRKSKQIDHINRNKLDSRIENLRLVTSTQNKFNTEVLPNNTSGHRGVFFSKSRNYWYGSVQIKRKRKTIICSKDKAKVILAVSKYLNLKMKGVREWN